MSGLQGPLVVMTIIALIAGLFMGDLLMFILVLSGVVLGIMVEMLLHNMGSSLYNWLMKKFRWQPFESTLSRQLLSVFARKLSLSLPAYLYGLTVLYFILTIHSNVQVMALIWGAVVMVVVSYESVADDLDSRHDLPSLVAVFIEFIFMAVMFFVASLANYVWPVDFSMITILFVSVFVLTNLYVGYQQIQLVRE